MIESLQFIVTLWLARDACEWPAGVRIDVLRRSYDKQARSSLPADDLPPVAAATTAA
jgi:hypothetical protein